MATNPPPTPTLKCKECDYQNEPERVYCHNCGAKLDRSVLPKEEQIRRESPDRARKRIMKMTNPAASVLRRELGALVKTVVSAVVVAMIVQAMREPATLPKKSEAPPRLVASDLGNLADSATPLSGFFTEDEINTYLKSKVIPKGSVPGVEVKRAYIDLEPGTARIGVEKSLYGYPIYMATLYRVEASNGVLVAVNIGGSIGRLPIHPLIMERVSPLMFGSLAEALKREYGLLGKMQSVLIRKDRVDLVSKGKK
ncbi:MAG TPA: hypothetical protein VGO11_01275 [Chthoniobacteraceae bacterium]|jgi:hypothetical protein|nr:hypothetical protein [Chthoniobacteraceae bacterium]